jgi:hypothetical protein
MHIGIPRRGRTERPRARTLIGTVTAALVLALGVGGIAQAYPGPGDDRMTSAPTAWWTWQNIDPATLAADLNQDGARLTDLRVSSASPLLFTATAVANSGSYGSAWWWYYGVTGAQVGSLLSRNNARLISAVRYGNVYAVVMIPNTGPNATAWWWWDTDANGIATTTAQNNARVTNIMSYAPGRFVVIEVDNTGANSYAWWWYYGISLSTLTSLASGKTTLDISYNNDGSNTFNVAMISQPGNDGRVFTFSSIGNLVSYALAPPPDRPVFVAPYGNGSQVVTSLRHDS